MEHKKCNKILNTWVYWFKKKTKKLTTHTSMWKVVKLGMMKVYQLMWLKERDHWEKLPITPKYKYSV